MDTVNKEWNIKVVFITFYKFSVTVEELLQLFKDNVVELPVILCSIYGFRRSEVLGLKWENVDFVKRTIYIVETLQQNTGGDYTDETKTESSTRTMPITKKAYTVLYAKKQE